jgi:hypothetical protein
MTDSTGGHYTAVVEIVHSTPKTILNNTRGIGTSTESAERVKRDVARVIIRSDSIADLTAQVQAHLALVKDYR